MNRISKTPSVTIDIPSSESASVVGTLNCNVSVRLAIDSQDVDAVDVLRCRAFGQGKEVYQSLKKRIQPGPFFLLGGVHLTNLYVAVAKPKSMDDLHLARLVLKRDLDRLLSDGWLSNAEFDARREDMRVEPARGTELVVGAVDCSVLERVDASLQLRRSLYISSMAVREEFRGRGIARAMLAAVDAHAASIHGVREVYLHVEDDNDAALRLYASAGFAKPDASDAGAAYLARMLLLTVHVPPRSAMLCKLV